jgi:hypothetical protein
LTAAAVGAPTLVRAQPRTVKIGMVSPVSGPMADVLGLAPRVVWPRDVAEQKFVFPRPRA